MKHFYALPHKLTPETSYPSSPDVGGSLRGFSGHVESSLKVDVGPLFILTNSPDTCRTPAFSSYILSYKVFELAKRVGDFCCFRTYSNGDKVLGEQILALSALDIRAMCDLVMKELLL